MRPIAFVIVLIASTTAFAHKMEVSAKIPAEDPGIVRVVVGYDTDEPTEKATVTVVDLLGRVVAEGSTNEHGVWSFSRPKAGNYTIRADDGAGHRAEVPFPVPEGEADLVEVSTQKRNRILMSVAGVVIIGFLFFGLRWIVRFRPRKRRSV